MKRKFLRTTALLVSLVMALAMLSACENKTDDMQAMVDAAVQSAMAQAGQAPVVTIAADGKTITIEDTDGLSIQQLLDQAGITLNEGDVLSVNPAQSLSTFTVQVLRRNVVNITVAAGEDQNPVHYTIVLFDGTVADALVAAGIEITDSNTLNLELDAPIENGMEITVTAEEEKPVEESTEPETEPEEDEEVEDNNDDNSSSNNSSSNNSSSNNNSGNNNSNGGSNNDDDDDDDDDDSSSGGRTVVSVQVYEDCDGSGHGVKVITYSDGTQEEVYF